jgi:hypothetical protein
MIIPVLIIILLILLLTYFFYEDDDCFKNDPEDIDGDIP